MKIVYEFGDLAIVTTKKGRRFVAEYTDSSIDSFWWPVLGMDGLEGGIIDPEVSIEVIGKAL